jgi:hypothetical protein
MQKTVFPIAFGAGFQLRRFTIDHNDLTDADTSQTITLFALGGKDAVMGVRIKHSTAFTGGGVGSCTVSVGGSVEGATGFAAAFNIFQAAAATTGQMTQCFKNGTSDGQDVQAVFTVDTTCAALTAGQVDIDVLTMTIAAADIA